MSDHDASNLPTEEDADGVIAVMGQMPALADYDADPVDSLPPLVKRLVREPTGFNFFQAVSLLERARPDGKAAGHLGPVEEETLRFKAHASLGFAASDVTRISFRPGDEEHGPRYDLTVTFLGLYGPSSPLPPHYSEHIVSSDIDHSNVQDFLDLFNHRSVALLYRVWRKYRYYASYQYGARDLFSERVYSFLGLSRSHLDRKDGLNWVRLLPYTGLLSLYGHSATMLRRVISHYFDGVQTDIEEWVPRRVRIPVEQMTRLGSERSQLGSDLIVGESVPDVSGKFRVWLGPLDFEQFQSFLPDGENHEPLKALIRIVLRDQLDFDLALILDDKARPHFKLGAGAVSRLGWSGWLGTPDIGSEIVVVSAHLEESTTLF